MTTPDAARPLHSSEYFGESRDHWWNSDFLSLMARRLTFERVSNVLDVGCGVGHWGRALLPHLPATARLIGIDAEAEWVRVAQGNADARGLGDRTIYRQGVAEHLPFPDNTFDLATCQTVLIHVRDPRAVIREMVRVLRPGGLFLAAEPNNLASSMVVGSESGSTSVDDRLRLVRFQVICERGKEQLGEGNNSIGDLVPRLLAESGAKGVRVYLSDRAYMMLPPYESAGEQAERAQALDWAGRDFCMWAKADTRRYFLAGGGDTAEFDVYWEAALAAQRADAEALRDGRYYSPGGVITYIVSGRKPDAH